MIKFIALLPLFVILPGFYMFCISQDAGFAHDAMRVIEAYAQNVAFWINLYIVNNI